MTLDTNPGFQPFGFAGGLYDRAPAWSASARASTTPRPGAGRPGTRSGSPPATPTSTPTPATTRSTGSTGPAPAVLECGRRDPDQDRRGALTGRQRGPAAGAGADPRAAAEPLSRRSTDPAAAAGAAPTAVSPPPGPPEPPPARRSRRRVRRGQAPASRRYRPVDDAEHLAGPLLPRAGRRGDALGHRACATAPERWLQPVDTPTSVRYPSTAKRLGRTSPMMQSAISRRRALLGALGGAATRDPGRLRRRGLADRGPTKPAAASAPTTAPAAATAGRPPPTEPAAAATTAPAAAATTAAAGRGDDRAGRRSDDGDRRGDQAGRGRDRRGEPGRRRDDRGGAATPAAGAAGATPAAKPTGRPPAERDGQDRDGLLDDPGRRRLRRDPEERRDSWRPTRSTRRLRSAASSSSCCSRTTPRTRPRASTSSRS